MIGGMAKTGNRAGTTAYTHNKRMRLTMDFKKAEAIIDYVVSTTKPLWEQWINLSYADLDAPYILFIWSVQDSN